jgi:cytochrome c oxidase subunit II
MAAAEAVPAGPARQEPRHGLRIVVIWVVLSLAADLVIWFVWGPHMPPGDMSSSAAGQQFDFNVLAVIAAPVMIGVFTYFGYALTVWRQQEGDDEDGPGYLPGAVRVQATWIAVTSAIVLGLAVFGTYELIAPAGAGSGQGPQPAFNNGVLAAASDTSWAPNTNNILQVQVIAQQWLFTYRYPQFGGFETTDLVLPVGQQVRFNVTSLDVVHSFWAYELGVKADANPFVNNVAYTTPKQAGGFTVRCAELCGLWHGAMYNYGKVEPVPDFLNWAHSTETRLASLTRTLPPYALIYTPSEISGLAKFYYQAGVPGAGAQYYGPQYPAEP